MEFRDFYLNLFVYLAMYTIKIVLMIKRNPIVILFIIKKSYPMKQLNFIWYTFRALYLINHLRSSRNINFKYTLCMIKFILLIVQVLSISNFIMKIPLIGHVYMTFYYFNYISRMEYGINIINITFQELTQNVDEKTY